MADEGEAASVAQGLDPTNGLGDVSIGAPLAAEIVFVVGEMIRQRPRRMFLGGVDESSPAAIRTLLQFRGLRLAHLAVTGALDADYGPGRVAVLDDVAFRGTKVAVPLGGHRVVFGPSLDAHLDARPAVMLDNDGVQRDRLNGLRRLKDRCHDRASSGWWCRRGVNQFGTVMMR